WRGRAVPRTGAEFGVIGIQISVISNHWSEGPQPERCPITDYRDLIPEIGFLKERHLPDQETQRRHDGGEVARRGLMVVLSSPSGAGKTTLSRMLLDRYSTIELSISVTTRKPRPGEVEGRDYRFIDEKSFDAMVARSDLLEWAEVFGSRYGTPRAPVERALAMGRDVLFDIDWQGTQQLREKGRDDLVSVFVLPPTIADLQARLRALAQEPDDVIRARMAKAANEMSHW